MNPKPKMSWNKIVQSNYVAILLIIACFLFRFHDELFNYILIGGGFDQAMIFSPLFIKVSAILGAGESALWIPELQGGIPIYHSPLMSMHYPFYGLEYMDYTDWVGAYRKMTIISLLHILLYGLSIFCLLKCFDIKSLYAGIIGGASIGSGMLYFHSKWIIALAGFSWIPLFLTGIILMFKKPKSYLGALIAAFAFSMIILAKPSQPTIYTFYYGFFLIGILFIRNYKNYKLLIPKVLLFGSIVIGISAIVFVPILNYTDLYLRPSSSGVEVGNNLIPISSYSKGMSIQTIKHMLQYSLKSMGMGNLYIGASILLLAPFGFASLFGRAFAQYKFYLGLLLMIGLYCLISSMGVDSLFFELNRKLPLMNQLRHPLRFMFFVNITLYLLAGLGIEKLIKDENKLQLIFFLFTLLLLSFIQFEYSLLNLILIVLAGFIFISVNFYKQHLQPIIVCIALLFSLVFSYYHISKKKITYTHNSLFYKNENIEAQQLLRDLAGLDDQNPLNYRFNVIDEKIPTNWWSAMGTANNLRSFNSIMPPYLKKQRQEVQTHKDPLLRALWGSKYTIYNRADTDSLSPNQTSVLKSKNFIVVKNKNFAPRFYLSSKLKKTRSTMESFKRSLERSSDEIGKIGFTTDKDLLNIFQKKDLNAEENSLKVLNQTNNSTELACDIRSTCILIINEFYSKEWKITVNDKLVDPHLINHNQMGVLLNEGTYKIHIRYGVSYIKALGWLSNLSLLICCILIFYFIYKNEN